MKPAKVWAVVTIGSSKVVIAETEYDSLACFYTKKEATYFRVHFAPLARVVCLYEHKP